MTIVLNAESILGILALLGATAFLPAFLGHGAANAMETVAQALQARAEAIRAAQDKRARVLQERRIRRIERAGE